MNHSADFYILSASYLALSLVDWAWPKTGPSTALLPRLRGPAIVALAGLLVAPMLETSSNRVAWAGLLLAACLAARARRPESATT